MISTFGINTIATNISLYSENIHNKNLVLERQLIGFFKSTFVKLASSCLTSMYCGIKNFFLKPANIGNNLLTSQYNNKNIDRNALNETKPVYSLFDGANRNIYFVPYKGCFLIIVF